MKCKGVAIRDRIHWVVLISALHLSKLLDPVLKIFMNNQFSAIIKSSVLISYS